MDFKTEQEAFWAGEFGDDYNKRNKSDEYLASSLNFFSKAFQQAGRPAVQIVKIRALQCVLILGVAVSAPDGQILIRLHDQRRSRHNGKFSTQTIDHIIGSYISAGLPEVLLFAYAALFQRLQHHKEAALIQGRAAACESNGGLNGAIFHHDVYILMHLVAHGLE